MKYRDFEKIFFQKLIWSKLFLRCGNKLRIPMKFHELCKNDKIRSGFDVYAGEQDRFGWLIGCISLKRGILYFG